MINPILNSYNNNMMPPASQQEQKTQDAKEVTAQKGLQSHSNSFDLSFTTSSGDTLTLSMSSNIATAYEKNAQGSKHTLSREFSYEMKFQSNGLTQQDRKELAKALEEANPSMVDFFERVNKDQTSVVDNFRNNLSTSLKQQLQPLQDQTNTEQIKSETAKEINKALNTFDINERLFEQASKLFEEIFDSSRLLNFSA